jgi:hypothetical protein
MKKATTRKALPAGVAKVLKRLHHRLPAASPPRQAAARRYFEKAIAQNGAPVTVTVDKSGDSLFS